MEIPYPDPDTYLDPGVQTKPGSNPWRTRVRIFLQLPDPVGSATLYKTALIFSLKIIETCILLTLNFSPFILVFYIFY